MDLKKVNKSEAGDHLIEVSYTGKDSKNSYGSCQCGINESDYPPDAPILPDYFPEQHPPEQHPEQSPQPCTDPLREYGLPFGYAPGFGAPGPIIKNPRGNIHFLTVIGQIEGHTTLPPFTKTTKYEHVIPQLVMVADSPEIDGMLILLNTVGGDVEAGLAIAELISKLGKPTVSLVIGGGHSIGVPLAVSAGFSFIAPSATMTIHPVRLNGTVVGAPQTYDYFNKMQERVSAFITANSKITPERLSSLMLDTNKLALDVGTILIGEDAVNECLIDATGGLHDALEKLYEMIESKRNDSEPESEQENM